MVPVFCADAGHMGASAAGDVAAAFTSTASVRPLKMLSQYHGRDREECAAPLLTMAAREHDEDEDEDEEQGDGGGLGGQPEGSGSLQGSSPTSLPVDICIQAMGGKQVPARENIGGLQSALNAVLGPSKSAIMAADSLERAFLASTDTPPHEQLLGSTSVIEPSPDRREGVLSSSLPKKPAFGGASQRRTPSASGAIGRVEVEGANPGKLMKPASSGISGVPTPPMGAASGAGSATAATSHQRPALKMEHWADIQGMRICKVKMPPLPPPAKPKGLDIRADKAAREPSQDDGRPATTSQPTAPTAPTAPSVFPRSSEPSAPSPIGSKRLGQIILPPEDQPDSQLPPQVIGSVHTASSSMASSEGGGGAGGGAFWLGNLIPITAVSTPEGPFKVFLARVSEVPAPTKQWTKPLQQPKSSGGWGHLRTRLVLRTSLCSSVDDMAAQIDAEIFKLALANG